MKIPEKRFILRVVVNSLGFTLSSYLLYGQLIDYQSNETYTSNTVETMQPENFPDIMVCPFPAFDLKKMSKHGYKSSFDFIRGDGVNISGWAGISNSSVENVIQDVSIFNSVNKCPKIKVKFDNNETSMHLELYLTNLVYPHGLCCKPIIPKLADQYLPKKIVIYVDKSLNSNVNIECFQTYLKSQSTSHTLKMDTFDTHGISIKAYSKKNGLQRFDLKLHKYVQLEIDPKANCKNYREKHGYAKVCKNVSKCLNSICTYLNFLVPGQSIFKTSIESIKLLSSICLNQQKSLV